MENIISIGFRPFIREADVTYSLFNFSVCDATNLSPAVPQNITPADYLYSYTQLLGEPYKPGVPTDPNSTFSNFIETMAYTVAAPFGAEPNDNVDFLASESTLRTFLVIPLLISQRGNFPLPPGLFNVSVELAQGYDLLSVPPWSVIVYFSVASLVFLWCIGGIITALFIDSPPASSFDVVDFATGVTANTSDRSFVQVFASLPLGNDSDIRKGLKDKSVFVRDISVFESEGDGIHGGWKDGKVGFFMDGRYGRRILAHI